MQVAVERVGARLRVDVEKRHSNLDVRRVWYFIQSTLELLVEDLREGYVEADFLVSSFADSLPTS